MACNPFSLNQNKPAHQELNPADEKILDAILDANHLDKARKWDYIRVENDRVVHLYLSGDSITGLPAEIGNLTELKSLELSRNNLRNIPPEIGNLKKLTSLDLSHNSLGSLPVEIGNLAQLEDLNVNFNLLTSVPAEIGNLKRLKSLEMEHNYLSDLPNSFFKLEQLGYLNLIENKFCFLSEDILYWANHSHNSSAAWYTQQDCSIKYSMDSLAVFHLLKANGVDSIPVESVSGREGDRIVHLKVPGMGLKKIPAEIGSLTELKSLDLSYNKISSLPDTFSHMTNLVILLLNDNGLTDLPGSIMNCKPRGGLTLGHNPLCNLTPNQLDWATSFDSQFKENNRNDCSERYPLDTLAVRALLDANNMVEEKIAKVSLSRNGRIVSLNLASRNIGIVPPEIGNMDSLEELDCTNNHLKSLPGGFGKLAGLKKLLLGRNELTDLPDSMVYLARLSYLTLEKNRLCTLSQSLQNFADLSWSWAKSQTCSILTPYDHDSTIVRGLLNRYGMQDTSVNKIALLTGYRITTIFINSDLFSNLRITSFPVELAKLDSLKALYLRYTGITEIPDGISGFSKLEHLGLPGNPIQKVSQNLSELVHLQELILSGGSFTSLPDSCGKWVNLKTLNLANNRLTTIPAAFINFKQLESLELQGNAITSAPELLTTFPSLKKLNLQGNRVALLPETIGHLVNLEYLNVSENLLETLPLSIFTLKTIQLDLMPTMGKLQIQGNLLCNVSTEVETALNKKYPYAVVVPNWKESQKCQGNP